MQRIDLFNLLNDFISWNRHALCLPENNPAKQTLHEIKRPGKQQQQQQQKNHTNKQKNSQKSLSKMDSHCKKSMIKALVTWKETKKN